MTLPGKHLALIINFKAKNQSWQATAKFAATEARKKLRSSPEKHEPPMPRLPSRPSRLFFANFGLKSLKTRKPEQIRPEH
ncbi:MAG: hypothetical protein DMG81_08955 [Acidobacteria bacterium]|nr:MAG: hypothetical protein DMG81_08955 [Acidobacteriota bacterium]